VGVRVPLSEHLAMQWLEPMPVRDWMHRDPVVVRADAPIAVATDLLRTRKIRHLPVVDGRGRLVGIVTDRDLEWAAEVHDARTAPRAWLEPTWVIYSDSHAVFPHVYGVP